MTLYLDPCVLLAFLAGADQVMAVSSWCETELTSALGLKIRTNQLTADQAEAVLFT